VSFLFVYDLETELCFRLKVNKSEINTRIGCILSVDKPGDISDRFLMGDFHD
jgi:hypothetical protein